MVEVSIIMPSHNSQKTILASIDSICKQSFKNWELIIVDDFSSDKTLEYITYVNDKRIRIETLPSNIGAAKARNKGIELARGRYIAFLDSDDLWHPQKLELQINFMKRENIDFCFTAYEVINNQMEVIKTIKVPSTMTYKKLLKNTIIGCLTVVVDTKRIGKFYMPEYKTGEDTATWLNILKQGYIARAIELPLAAYRKEGPSLSNNKWNMAANLWKIYRKTLKISFLKSCWYFLFYTFNGFRKNFFINKSKEGNNNAKGIFNIEKYY